MGQEFVLNNNLNNKGEYIFYKKVSIISFHFLFDPKTQKEHLIQRI